jgi:ribose-phosphate pyrophosphokinase
MQDIRLFGVNGTEDYAKCIARQIGQPLTPRVEKLFGDGEPYIKSVVGEKGNVRNCDCYIICSLFSDPNQSVNDKLVKLLFFTGSLKDASARRVTLVIPYLAYQRQDRKTESRAGIYTKYLAMLMERAGADRLVTMDVHNLAAFQSSMRFPVDNLEARNLLADFLCGGSDRKHDLPIENHIPNPLFEHRENLAVLSPDSGGLQRCRLFRDALQRRLNIDIDVFYLDKERDKQTGEVKGGRISGDIKGKKIIVYDDMIASGGTVELCDETVKGLGGEVWAVCATHGIFTGKASERLQNIQRLVVTDTIPSFRLPKDDWKDRLYVVRTTGMFAEAIRCTYYGGSISELLD